MVVQAGDIIILFSLAQATPLMNQQLIFLLDKRNKQYFRFWEGRGMFPQKFYFLDSSIIFLIYVAQKCINSFVIGLYI